MAIKIEKLKEEKKRGILKFMLKGSNEVFANSIRRLIIEEVPTLAIEDIEIKENSSALFDEMLALRIGLIPIKTDLKSYTSKEKCKCEGVGCAQCELKITLKTNKKGYVYASEAESADPKCTFVYEKMPIVKLLPKQKLDLTMTAVLNNGREHTKWTPGWAFYKKEPVITINKVKNPELIAQKSTDNVFTLKNKKLELNEDRIYDSNLLEYYAELDGGISLEYTDNILFTLESWGQLSCKEILHKSSEIFLEKIEEMEKLI
ncbi:DNA-directed RNA polymerase subunit D [Candidatus Woesearchaeota archaeon]|nr:DNA-directed RNA polymerase subunit D [Candidatus Woesearchaeota archaeon]